MNGFVSPLLHRGEVIGALSADNKYSQRSIHQEELTLVALFVSQAVVALANVQLFEEAKRQVEQLEELRRTTLAITSPLEYNVLLRTILTHATKLLKAKGSGFYKYYPDRKELEIIADLRPSSVGRIVRIGEGVVGRLVQKEQPYRIIDNYYEDPERMRDWAEDTVFCALLEVPVIWKGQMLGVLFVGDNVGRKFTDDDAELLISFADQAANTLINAESKEIVQSQRLEEKLSSATKEINGELGKTTLSERLELVAKHVLEILDAEASCVFLKHSPDCLRLEAAYGHVPGSREIGREYLICSGPRLGLVSHIASEGKSFREHGKALREHWASDGSAPGQLPSGERCSMMTVPLRKSISNKEQLFGLIRVENKRGKNGRPHYEIGFTKEDERILSNFAEIAMVAIENDTLVNELQEQRERWSQLVESSPNGIIALDRDGRVTEYNSKAQEILIHNRDEVINQHMDFLYYDEGEAQKIGDILHVHKGKIIKFPTSMRSKREENIPIHLSASWLYDAQRKRIGSVGYFEDLRDIKKLERQRTLLLQALRAVSRSENSTAGLQSLVEMLVSVLGHSFCRLLTQEGELELCVRAAYANPSRTPMLSWDPKLGQHISFADLQEAGVLPQNGTPRLLDRSQKEDLLVKYSYILELQQNLSALLVIPLQIDKQLIGLLEVGEMCENEHRVFTEEQIALVTAIAAQSTVLIHNMLLFEEAEAARERLQASFQASSKLLSASEPAKVLREIVESARVAADASGVRIILRDETGDPRIEVVTPERYQNPSFQVRWLDSIGVSWEVIRTGEPQIISDIDKSNLQINPALRREGTQALCCMPLLLQEETIGVMSFYYDHSRYFPPFEIEALQLFANQAAAAYDSARRLDQVKKSKYAAEMVARATALGGSEVTLESIAQKTKEAIDCDEVALYVYKQGFSEANYTISGQPSRVFGVTFRTYAELLPEIEPGLLLSKFLGYDEPYIPMQRLMDDLKKEFGKEWSIIMPLRVNEQKMGLMLVGYDAPHRFSLEELTSLELFAKQIAVAIHNSQLYRKAQKRASVLQALYEAGQVITSSLNAREILERMANQAWIPDHRSDHGIILNTWIKEGPMAVRIAGRSDNARAATHVTPVDKIDLRSEKGERIGLVGRAMTTGEVQWVVEQIHENPDYVTRHSDVQSELVVPVKVDDEVVGAINVEHPDEYAFDQEDIKSLQALAAQASVAISLPDTFINAFNIDI